MGKTIKSKVKHTHKTEQRGFGADSTNGLTWARVICLTLNVEITLHVKWVSAL